MQRTRRIMGVVGVLLVLTATAAAAGAGSAGVPADKAVSASNEKYVASAVYDSLGRLATEGDLNRWGEPLDSGQSHGDFAASLINSSDRKAHVVTTIYRKVFLRDPDAGGLAYWTTKLTRGFRSANLAAALYASNEFYEGAGGTNDAYVKVIYLSLLDRAADDFGLAYWVGRLDAGAPRSALTRSFYLARESNSRRVVAIFNTFLGRAPNRTDLTFWRTKLTTVDDDVLVMFIVGSDEYYYWTQVRPVVGPTTTSTTRPGGSVTGPSIWTTTSSSSTSTPGSTSSTSWIPTVPPTVAG